MSAKELFGVAVRSLAVGMIAWGTTFCFWGLLGSLSPVVVGLILLLASKWIVGVIYGWN